MAIFTPRGLKIVLPIDLAFALLKRLHPRVKPFDVLKRVEAMEIIPAYFLFLATIAVSFSQFDFIASVLIISGVTIYGKAISTYGWYSTPFIVEIGCFFSYFYGFGFLSLIIALVAYLTKGWLIFGAYILSWIASGIIGSIMERSDAKTWQSRVGVAYMTPEKNFFNSYIMYANELNLSNEIKVSQEELRQENWGPILTEFACDWPVIVSRFSR